MEEVEEIAHVPNEDNSESESEFEIKFTPTGSHNRFTTMEVKNSGVTLTAAKDYPKWAEFMKTWLKGQKLWMYVDGTKPKPNAGAQGVTEEQIMTWDANDAKAATIILSHIDTNQWGYLSNKETSKEKWDALKKVHSQSSKLNQHLTSSQYQAAKIAEDEPVMEGIQRILDLAESLKQLGSPIPTSMIITKILAELPSKYAVFAEVWTSKSEDQQQDLDVFLLGVQTATLRMTSKTGGTEETHEAFYTRGRGTRRGGRGARGGTRGRSRGRGGGQQYQQQVQSNNERQSVNEEEDDVQRCYNCNSEEHFAYDCDKPRRGRGRGRSRGGNRGTFRRGGRGRAQSSYYQEEDEEDEHEYENRAPTNSSYYSRRNREGYGGASGSSFMALYWDDIAEPITDITGEIETEEKVKAVSFVATNKKQASDLLFYHDSGSSHHSTGDKSLFTKFEKFERPWKIRVTGDNNFCHAYGKGQIEMQFLTQDENGHDYWRDGTLENVLYIPGSINLFSGDSMDRKGYKVTTHNGTLTSIDADGWPGPSGDKGPGKLYIMRFRRKPPQAWAMLTLQERSTLMHNRLAHVCMENLRLTANAHVIGKDGKERKAVIGLDPNDFKKNVCCEDCKLGKQTKLPHKTVDKDKDLWVGQVLHMDLTGEMDETPGGSKYCLVVVDEKSNYVRLVFLTNKGDTSREVIKMIKWFTTQTGNYVTTIRSDHGTEFKTRELDTFLQKKQIEHGLSAKYTPQQNGRVERQMRQIKDLARTMLIQSGLSKKFWAEACNTGVYILNRTITRNNYVKTPYQQVFRKIPTLQHVRMFGSTAYYRVPHQKRRSMDAVARKGILVGYGNENNYRIWDPKIKDIIITHDATFNEHFVKYVPIKFNQAHDPWEEPEKEDEDCSENESREGGSDDDETDHDEIFEQARETTPPHTPSTQKTSPQTPAAPADEHVTPLASPDKEPMQGPSNQGASSGQPLKILIEDQKKGKYIASIPAGTTEVKVTTKSGRTIVPPARFQPEQKERKGSTSSVKSDSGRVPKPKTKKNDNDERGSTSHLCAYYGKEEEEEPIIASSVSLPATYKEAIKSEYADKWKGAIEEEHKSLLENETYEIVARPDNSKVMDTRYVLVVKSDAQGRVVKWKARLVARGYQQEYGIDYNEVFASVARLESARLILAISIKQDFYVRMMDVQTAFLQAELEEDVYVEIPDGFPKAADKVWKLKRPLYGLKQAPRQWNIRLRDYLVSVGFSPSMHDPAVYIHRDQDVCFIVTYVDDLILAGSTVECVDTVRQMLKDEFKINDTANDSFIGMQIMEQEDGSIIIHTKKAIMELLEKFSMDNCSEAKIPMSPNQDFPILLPEETDYSIPFRQIIGSLLYISRTCRVDVAYSVNKLSQHCAGYDERHYKMVKKILKYLKGTADLGIKYDKADTDMSINIYSDSDYAGDRNDRKSTTGYVVCLGDAVIHWKTHKQKIITLSSTEAELVALTEACKEAEYYIMFMNELGFGQTGPISIYCDNTSTIQIANYATFHDRRKHIDTQYFYSRNLVEDKKIVINHVTTHEQKADILTKPLAQSTFEKVRGLLNMDTIKMHVKTATKIVGQRVTTKRRSSPSPFSLLTIVQLLLLASNVSSSPSNTQPPIIWRQTDTPVISGYLQMEVIIKLLSPCEELKDSEILHPDLRDSIIDECARLYKSEFLNELGTMCPGENTGLTTHKLFKRFVEYIIAAVVTVIVVIVVAVALGIAALVVAVQNQYRLDDLEESNNLLIENMRRMENNQANMDSLMTEGREKFNHTVTVIGRVTEDVERLKQGLPYQSYAIAEIVASLKLGKLIIQEARRHWKQGRVHMPLFDYFNITLPCKLSKCSYMYAKPETCSLDLIRKQVKFVIDVPIKRESYILLSADPFVLMKRFGNKTCQMKYRGPSQVIASNQTDCLHPLMTDHARDQEVIVYPVKDCSQDDVNRKDMQSFDMINCAETTQKDYLSFIQLKRVGYDMLIYCPMSTINMTGTTQECPNHVFALPIFTTFIINNIKYNGSTIIVKGEDRSIQLWTAKINWYLMRSAELEELYLKDSNFQREPIKDMVPIHSTGHHYGLETFLAVITIGLILIAILVVQMIVKKKNPTVRVQALPYQETIELQELGTTNNQEAN